MALHSQLPIYREAKALLVTVAEISASWARNRRRLAEKLNDECIEVTLSVFRANVAEDKLPHLDALREHLEVANLLLALAKDLRLISPEQWARAIEHTTSIGRQNTGWRKKSATSPASLGVRPS